MNRPIDTAAKGLLQAQNQFAQSAARVAAPQLSRPNASFDVPQQPVPNRPGAKPGEGAEQRRPAGSPSAGKAQVGSTGITSQGSYLPSLAEETMQMRIAANAYSANARLMEAAQDFLAITQETLAAQPEEDSEES